MIYFLHGPDTYRSFKKLQQIKQRYLSVSGDTDLVTLEGESLTKDDFRRQVQTRPFLAKNRLVIVRDLLTKGNKEVIADLVGELKVVPSSTVLFFYETGKPDVRTKIFNALNQPKQSEAFDLPVGSALATYVKKQAELKGLTLQPKQIELLVTRVGGDLWQVENELEKLALYAMANGQTDVIVEADIEALTMQKPGLDSIFALTDAFGAREGKRALTLLSATDPDESGHGLLGLVASQYRTMILLADALAQDMPRQQLSKQLGLHPFVVEKTLSMLHHYTQDELRIVYYYLFELDMAGKLSIAEPLLGLKVLAASLTQKPLVLPEISEEKMVQ